MMFLVYYLLKVLICSTCLFLYYHLALKNKVFHQWNRFYLLSAVVLSLLLPLLQITVWHTGEEDTKAIQLIQVVQSADNYLEEFTVTNNKNISPEKWIAAGYTIICFSLLMSLLISVLKIVAIIRSHAGQWLHNIRFINTNEPGTPFSFFHFIFWNKNISLQSQTGQQIFRHELVHVQKKHTLDKLFMQVVLILFWCNPFFWLIRRELRFIHEFIADKRAVGEQGTPAFAAMILQTAYPQHFNAIANPFFQTAIKRRLQMLTKIQNPGRAYLSRIIALPLIALIAFAFTVRTKTDGVPVIPLQKEIVVVIDAAHGKMANGSYNGARSGNVYEDVIALALAKKIQELNTNDRIKIVLTRSDENIVALKDRLIIAEKANADLFISIHTNATPSPVSGSTGNKGSKEGMEVYVSAKNTPFQGQSELLGSALQQKLQGAYKTYPGLIKSKVGVWVIDQNVCPSVLVECGYLTSEKDKAFITNPVNQELIAQKILGGIESYALTMQGLIKGVALADTVPKKTSIPNESVLDLLQKNRKQINSVAVNKNENKITVTYSDGSVETCSENEALQKGLIAPDSSTHTRQPNAGTAVKPLIIVDGKEVPYDIMNKLNTDKIQSINILKDKLAIAKYGEKAKTGVIEITMKSGAAIQDKTEGRQIATPIYILEGKEIDEAEMKKIEPDKILAIQVLKDKMATDKYGVRGKNGVVEIALKNTGQASPGTPNSTTLLQPIYIVDGKEITTDEMNKINPSNIQSMTILKDKSATDKYGVRGKNGVVEITMKKITLNNVIIRENDKKIGVATGEINTSNKEFHGTMDIDQQADNSPVFEQSETGASVDPAAWKAFLDKNLVPVVNEVSKSASNGRYIVNLRFIINTDGSLSNVKALNDPGYKIAPKVVEIMKYAPKWKPAMQNGKAVRSYHTQPITLVVSNT